jgi:hypothetical protein
MPRVTAEQLIKRIDGEIALIKKDIAHEHKVNKNSARSWQAAYDQEPLLKQRIDQLYCARGFLQLLRKEE